MKRVVPEGAPPSASAPRAKPAPVVERRSEAIVRTFTIPDNTAMTSRSNTALASDTSRVEQTVNGTLASPVVVDGDTVIPAGSSDDAVT